MSEGENTQVVPVKETKEYKALLAENEQLKQELEKKEVYAKGLRTQIDNLKGDLEKAESRSSKLRRM